MKLKMIAFIILIFSASTITAIASDYSDVRKILKDGNTALNKTADLELKYVYMTEKDSKLFMTNDSPACNFWIVYNKDQLAKVKSFIKDKQYKLKIKITFVGRFVINGDLLEIN